MTAVQPLQDWWDDFRIAIVFLTRLPVPLPAAPGNLAQASRTFPLVGVVVGAISAMVYAAAVDLGLTAILAAALSVGWPMSPMGSARAATLSRDSRSCATATSVSSARWR